MVFDIYFLNGDDLRGRILNRTKDQIESNTILKSRNEIMNDLFDNLIIDNVIIKVAGLQSNISKVIMTRKPCFVHF